MGNVEIGPFSWERMIGAVEKVRARLLRTAAALDAASIPYAVVGGNAVAVWVSRVDEAAVRNTQDVDILIRREDFDAVRSVLEQRGFLYRHVKSIDMFLDGTGAKARDAVHVLYSGERIRSDDALTAPTVEESERTEGFQVIQLSALVRMKLTSFHDKDRTHLRDMIEVELLDASWIDRLPDELAARLQILLDDPNG